MPRVVVVGVPPPAVAEVCRDLGQEILQVATSGELSVAFTQKPDALLVGPEADRWEVAQQAVALDPLVSVVVLSEDEDQPVLQRELLFTPFLTEHVELCTSSGPKLQQTVRRALESAQARRAHAARKSVRLSQLPPPPGWTLESGRLTETLLRVAPVGVLLLDAEGRVRESNARANDMLDRPRLVGEHLSTLLGEAGDATAGLLQGEEDQLQLRVSSDPPRVVELSAKRLDGLDERTLVVFHDVTRRVQAEEERQHAQSELAAAQRVESLGTLAGGVAHDFNNLLMVIQGSTELALMKLPSDDPAAELLANVLLAAERAAELTEALLNYAGRGTPCMEPFDMCELISGLERLLGVSAGKAVQIVVDAPSAPLCVTGDRRQLQQIVLNLVRNAADALGPAGGRVEISLTSVSAAAELDGRRAALLRVRDEGCGVSPESVERIFEPFFTTKVSGHGLGLAAVAGVVRLHQGAIRCESALGEGTTMRVWLPLEDAALATPEPLETPTAPAPRPATTVLVVDDEPLVQQVTVANLEAVGYCVLTADDGRHALEVLGREPGIDLVVMDMHMPRMGGRDAFLELRRTLPELPVLLCSGYVDEPVADLLEHGPTRFLKKPCDLSVVRLTINDLLRPRREAD